MGTSKLNGTIIRVSGRPNPNSYVIQDQDGNEYLAHVGDIKENEELLWKLDKENRLTKLKTGDTVEFESLISKHAIHVKPTH